MSKILQYVGLLAPPFKIEIVLHPGRKKKSEIETLISVEFNNLRKSGDDQIPVFLTAGISACDTVYVDIP